MKVDTVLFRDSLWYDFVWTDYVSTCFLPGYCGQNKDANVAFTIGATKPFAYGLILADPQEQHGRHLVRKELLPCAATNV
jgi:hypothetical protein